MGNVSLRFFAGREKKGIASLTLTKATQPSQMLSMKMQYATEGSIGFRRSGIGLEILPASLLRDLQLDGSDNLFVVLGDVIGFIGIATFLTDESIIGDIAGFEELRRFAPRFSAQTQAVE